MSAYACVYLCVSVSRAYQRVNRFHSKLSVQARPVPITTEELAHTPHAKNQTALQNGLEPVSDEDNTGQ